MSRVEENQKQLGKVEDSLKQLNGESGEDLAIMMLTKPDVLKILLAMAQEDILMDISKSLAMIADDLHYYRQYESDVIERRSEDA